jgi:hypothetical protein
MRLGGYHQVIQALFLCDWLYGESLVEEKNMEASMGYNRLELCELSFLSFRSLLEMNGIAAENFVVEFVAW